MGFHTVSASRNMRITQPHLDWRDNGDVYSILKTTFKKDSPFFEYCFLGENKGVFRYNGQLIEEHPKFKNIRDFESWCRRYMAENDI